MPPTATPRAVAWEGGPDGRLVLVDQRRLPAELVLAPCPTLASVVAAIKTLTVRGAPAIGVAAGYGVVVGVRERWDAQGGERAFATTTAELAASRPTARNLFEALERMGRRYAGLKGRGKAEVLEELLAEARRIHAEDEACCEAIGAHGWTLIPEGGTVMTHCHAGALATGGIGTAVGVMHRAAREGRRFRVFAGETRPLLQGARLTSWELQEAGIDVTLVCDNMASAVMAKKGVSLILVGADRIAANGDTANKIGTLNLAIIARHYGIPFYVAAPASTFDLSISDGTGIPIEERDPSEVRGFAGAPTSPPGVAVYNPAFDVTPAALIAGIITERGVLRPPFSLPAAFGSAR